MPDEILPFDFSSRIHIKTINTVPVAAQFFVCKRHGNGAQYASIDLLARSRRLRSIVEELIIARGARLEDTLTLRAENRRGLEMTLDQELTHRFISLMHAGNDSRCDEARRILLEALEPYLDAAEMQALTKEIAL